MSTMNTGTMSIYPGLLSHHWVQWYIKPHTTAPCNITDLTEIKMDFHIYSTIVLKLSNQDQILDIDMTFHQVYYTSTSHIPTERHPGDCAKTCSLSPNALQQAYSSRNALHYGHLTDYGEK